MRAVFAYFKCLGNFAEAGLGRAAINIVKQCVFIRHQRVSDRALFIRAVISRRLCHLTRFLFAAAFLTVVFFGAVFFFTAAVFLQALLPPWQLANLAPFQG